MTNKIYVDVVTIHYKSGSIKPLFIVWSNGQKYPIDKVKNICRAASLKAGGCGIRYTCIINNQERYLFLEENKWFIEGR
ncbi:MAG: hypothetical protein PHP11_06860 [Erysipelotrichaceae bacterium]|nr:hypothetical protein [Erysipelotrichaceae bacterium]MDD3924799.1 hypothetical protein [Erysipelotrichaceae bacterium]MDD4643316.1 hypothetical protein [Erysipelotrichaceae bacterium]